MYLSMSGDPGGGHHAAGSHNHHHNNQHLAASRDSLQDPLLDRFLTNGRLRFPQEQREARAQEDEGRKYYMSIRFL